MVTTPTVLSTDGAAKHRRHLVCFVGVMALAMVVSSGPAFGSARTAPTPICPSATANGRFVRQIYLQILGRCPGSAAGSYWTGRVDRGLSRPAFAEAIDVSTENMGKNNVDPVFQSFLSRPPTSSERTFWVDNVRTRHGDAVIRATLASSAEHYAQIGGANAAAKDQAWLTEAYEFILDRAPDPHGAAYFTRQLGAGGSTVATRFKVALKMEFTSENAQGWIRRGLQRGVEPRT